MAPLLTVPTLTNARPHAALAIAPEHPQTHQTSNPPLSTYADGARGTLSPVARPQVGPGKPENYQMAPAGTYYTTERNHSIRTVQDTGFFRPSYGQYRHELRAQGLTHWIEQQRKLVAAGELIESEGGGVRLPMRQDGGETQSWDMKGEL